MNPSAFPFADFVRAKEALSHALLELGESYVLLTGDTGTGKTALMRELRIGLDRAKYRVLYFAEARKLGPSGLIKVIGESLRVPKAVCHAVSFDRLQRTLAEEAQTLLIWLDEAHELPLETLDEARALVESDLSGHSRVRLFLTGLPKLRPSLQASPHLWRRIAIREEIHGLLESEMQAFIEHHFGPQQGKRLCEEGLHVLFERARGAPGILLPMYRAVLARSGMGRTKIDVESVEQGLKRWDLG